MPGVHFLKLAIERFEAFKVMDYDVMIDTKVLRPEETRQKAITATKINIETIKQLMSDEDIKGNPTQLLVENEILYHLQNL